MVKVTGLEKSYKAKKAINNMNFSLSGGVCGLLGPNGAGKTTLIRCITGVCKYSKGEIFIDSVNVERNPEIRNSIGYLPQFFGGFSELTVSEMIKLISNLKGFSCTVEDIEKVISMVNLTEQKNTRLKNLSGGMLRRVGIASAISGDPNIIIFDEPTAGLDPEERLRFKNIINEIASDDKLIIVSTHIVEDVSSMCDSILILNEGKVAFCGTSDSLKEKAYGKVFEISEDKYSNVSEQSVVKKYVNNNKKIIRFISNDDANGEAVDSTIEDGYLCVLKNL